MIAPRSDFLLREMPRYSYLQFGVVLPYIILVPCISKGGITLGSLQRLVNAFGSVERSFQFLVRNWSQILASTGAARVFLDSTGVHCLPQHLYVLWKFLRLRIVDLLSVTLLNLTSESGYPG